MTDWEVTADEEAKIVNLLAKEPDEGRVVRELQAAGVLNATNDGSRISIALLPETQAEFPGIRMAAYAQNSWAWPRDNISALGSEYTSKAWDDNLSPGWGDFVLNAYDDIKASGVL